MVKNSSGLGGRGSNNNFPNLMNSQGWTSSGTMTSQLNQRGVQRMLMRGLAIRIFIGHNCLAFFWINIRNYWLFSTLGF
jgi:hypothetical protein